MYTYRVVFGRSGVPEIGDLGASYEGDPGPQRSVFNVVFITGQEVARPPYDDAVGGPCRVIRTDDEGHSEEATGSVVTNSPLTVSLDGKGWSYHANVYLRFGAMTDAERREVLARLNSVLSADMTLSEEAGQHVVRVASPSDDAALIALNMRLQPLRSLLGLKDDQVMCGLDPCL